MWLYQHDRLSSLSLYALCTEGNVHGNPHSAEAPSWICSVGMVHGGSVANANAKLMAKCTA